MKALNEYAACIAMTFRRVKMYLVGWANSNWNRIGRVVIHSHQGAGEHPDIGMTLSYSISSNIPLKPPNYALHKLRRSNVASFWPPPCRKTVS